MLTVISMKESGLTIKLMDMVNISIIMELNILVIGRMINNMVKVRKLGQV